MGCPPFVEMATALKVFFFYLKAVVCAPTKWQLKSGRPFVMVTVHLLKYTPLIVFNSTPNRSEDRNMDPSKFEHHN